MHALINTNIYFIVIMLYGSIPAHGNCTCISLGQQVFMWMGLPQVVVSDQGREFNNQLDTEMMALFGINRRLTTAYHPQVITLLYNILMVIALLYSFY